MASTALSHTTLNNIQLGLNYIIPMHNLALGYINLYNEYHLYEDAKLNDELIKLTAYSGFIYITTRIIPDAYILIYFAKQLIDTAHLMSIKPVLDIQAEDLRRDAMIATQISHYIENLSYCAISLIIDNSISVFDYDFNTTLCDRIIYSDETQPVDAN